MLIRFFASEGKEREEGLARALRDGAAQFDDRVEIVPTDGFKEADPAVDVACAYGVKGHTKAIVEAYRSLGKRTVMFDKALVRPPGSPLGYHRLCLDGATPLAYMARKPRSGERWERLGIEIKPRKKSDRSDAIVFAGSSQKYCAMHGLGDATAYAKGILRRAHRLQRRRPLVYRPKPSWRDYRAIQGTRLSRGEGLSEVLAGAHVLVTHGSSAAVDAILAGVPAVTLGECAASPVAGRKLEDIVTPRFPDDEARLQWAHQLAWCQWHSSEIASGEAWAFIRTEIEATG